MAKGGAYAYGSYPDIDALFAQQAVEINREKRTALLHKLQELVHEKAMFAPIWQIGFLNAHGPRVGESGIGLIKGYGFPAPYEDITLTRGS